MQLQEFQKKINNGEKNLLKTSSFSYICNVLSCPIMWPTSYINIKARDLFVKLFKPKGVCKYNAFYGKTFDKENQKIRVEKLREFEKYCIEHESYKDW